MPRTDAEPGQRPGVPAAPLVSPGRLLVACVLVPGLCLATWLFDRQSIAVAPEAYRRAATVLANAGPVLWLLLALFAVTRRLLFSTLLCVGLQWLVYVVSAEKLAILEAPVGREDLHFLAGIDAGAVRLFWPYLAEGRPWLPWAAGAGLAVLALAFRLETPWLRRLGPARLVALALALAGAASLWAGGWPWNRLYSSQRIPAPAHAAMESALHWGTMSHVVRAHVQARARHFEVDPVALERLQASLAPQSPAPAPAQRPDVVVVLSESFFDPTLLNRAAHADPMPRLRQWIDAGHGGAMRSPTFGGGTILTEFEVLTGLPVAAFPGIGSPYAELEIAALPSLPRLLSRAGYRSVAVHGNSGGFYGRATAFRQMGFDAFLTVRDFPAEHARDGLWPSDRAMTDLVLDRLGREAPPLFVLSISMENHGPHGSEAAVSDEAAWNAIRLPEGLSGAAARQLRQSLYHLGNADAQFARLLEALQRRGRPFVLLFFGDHLPNLRDAFAELGFVDGRGARQQPVPWLLLRGQGEVLAPVARPIAEPWQLAAELMRETGLHDPYFETVHALGRTPGALDQHRAGLVALARARLQGGSAGAAP